MQHRHTDLIVHRDGGADRREHRHSWHELIVVLRGTYAVQTVDGPQRAGPGEAVLHPAGERHRPLSGEAPALLLLQWEGDLGLPPRSLLGRDRNGRLAAALHWLWDLQHDDSSLAQRDLLVQAVVLEWRRLARPEADRIGRMLRHLAAGPDLYDGAQSIGAIAGVGRRQAERLVKARTGAAPARLARQHLLERALNLLRTTPLPLEDVAVRCGLPSARALMAFLRRSTGRGVRALRGR